MGTRANFDVDLSGLTTSTTNYTAGDQLGTLITVASFFTGAGATTTIRGATLIDGSKVLGPVDVFFCQASVTLAADNAANSLATGDAANVIGSLSFGGQIAAANISFAEANAGLPLELNGSGTSLYVAFVTRSANVFFTASRTQRLRLRVEKF